jgi:molybdenum cofactor cytidylyltransferase
MPNDFKAHQSRSALILAAGNSSRMGNPKFMLKFDEEHTFLEKIIEGYKNIGCNEIVVVVNPKGALILEQYQSKIIDDQKIIINLHPEKERFFSIQTGLNAIKKTEFVFIHPVDNPWVIQSVLQSLLSNGGKQDYQIPIFSGQGGHPILISDNIVREICVTEKTNINFKEFLAKYLKTYVNVNSPEILVNINTPEDYKIFMRTKIKQVG